MSPSYLIQKRHAVLFELLDRIAAKATGVFNLHQPEVEEGTAFSVAMGNKKTIKGIILNWLLHCKKFTDLKIY